MNRNVTPCACSARIRANSRSIAAPSSWAVGSSRMMNRAPNDSARAISTSWRCSTVSAAGRLVDVDVDRPVVAAARAPRGAAPPSRSGRPGRAAGG